jgi:hypothetical protein
MVVGLRMEVLGGRRGGEIFIHVIVLVCVAFFLEVVLIGGDVRGVVVVAGAVAVAVVLLGGARAAGGATGVVRTLIARGLEAN